MVTKLVDIDLPEEVWKIIDNEFKLNRESDFEMITSLKWLSKDQRLRNTLQQIKNKFNNNFYNFERWSLI